MRTAPKIGLLFILAVTQLNAAEIANLRNGFGICHEQHQTFGDITRLYLDNEKPGNFIDVATSEIASFEPAPPEYDPPLGEISATQDLNVIISHASSRSQIDADFIASVIHAESANNPRAVSRKGAQGLMQLMPETAKNLGVKNSFDPAENVEAGTRFLRELLLRYNGDAAKALAAYNAGPQRVERYKGVPPFRETHAYIKRVIRDYNRLKLAQQQPSPAPPKEATSQSKVPALGNRAKVDPPGDN